MLPVDAVSLAGCIVQFVQFSVSLLDNSVKVYEKSTLPENDEVGSVQKDLDKLLRQIEKESFGHDQDFLELVKACQEVSQELNNALSKLKMKSGLKGMRKIKEALCKALRSSFQHDKVAELERRLRSIRDQLQFSLLYTISKNVHHISHKQGKIDQATKAAAAINVAEFRIENAAQFKRLRTLEKQILTNIERQRVCFRNVHFHLNRELELLHSESIREIQGVGASVDEVSQTVDSIHTLLLERYAAEDNDQKCQEMSDAIAELIKPAPPLERAIKLLTLLPPLGLWRLIPKVQRLIGSLKPKQPTTAPSDEPATQPPKIISIHKGFARTTIHTVDRARKVVASPFSKFTHSEPSSSDGTTQVDPSQPQEPHQLDSPTPAQTISTPLPQTQTAMVLRVTSDGTRLITSSRVDTCATKPPRPPVSPKPAHLSTRRCSKESEDGIRDQVGN